MLRHWFLAALITVLVVGFLAGDSANGFADAFPRRALVAFVLFLMSWSLDSHAFCQAIRKPKAAALGIFVNIIIVPVLAWICGHFLTSPLDVGLALAASVPCTLASAAVWTRRAGGNDAVALVVTMVTNFSCFLVTPLTLWLLTGASARDGFDPAAMIGSLFLIAVLPMAVGQLLRFVEKSARWATDNRRALSTVAQVGILTMVFIGAVKSAVAIDGATTATSLTALSLLAMLIAVTVTHVSALFGGFMLGRLAGLERAEWIAVGMAGSQKTLMIGLHVALALDLGVGVLPMVTYHAVQLILDTVVADRLAAQRR